MYLIAEAVLPYFVLDAKKNDGVASLRRRSTEVYVVSKVLLYMGPY